MLHMVIFYYIIFRINETKYCTYLQYIDFIKLNKIKYFYIHC